MNENNILNQIFRSKQEFQKIFIDFKEKRKNGAEIVALYKENFNHFNFYISYEALYSSYRSILGEPSEYDNSNLEEKIIDQLQKCRIERN